MRAFQRKIPGISLLSAALVAVALLGASGPAQSQDDRFILVQSTTSTEASGLFDHLLPRFEEMTGIDVRVVAVGTGQAIRNARNGDADVLFVHHLPSELAFVADGHGLRRYDVMYNDFVIVGPGTDPAGIRGQTDVTEALRLIHSSQSPFASRGDDSGTHKKELELWEAAGVDPRDGSGSWYREMGSGMGRTINTAVSMGAYVMTDRSTWLSYRNKGEYEILVEGDSRLFNQYGVILLNKERHPNTRAAMGQAFIDWLVSADGQATIASYRINGQQAFFPNAK